MSQQFKKREKTALDHMKLRMYGEKIDGSKDSPSFLFYMTMDGNPRIDVYTGVQGDKDNGLIRAAMDIRTARGFLKLMQHVVDQDGACRFYIENQAYSWPGGKRSEKPSMTSRTVVGKAEDGRVYVSVIADGRPKAIFYMSSPFFHKMTDSEGQRIDVKLESRLFTEGYVEHISELMSAVAAKIYVEPAPRQPPPGQGGGGYSNNNNQGGGNYQKPSAPKPDTKFDDDIPF
jgi:hypothetical protein